MHVYIEYVVIDNLVLNCIILALTKDLLRFKISKKRIFLAASIGTIFALFMPFIQLPNVLFLMLKISVGLCMVSVLKHFASKIEYITVFLVFLSVTFALGGVCFFVLELLGATVLDSNALMYQLDVPMGLILGIVFIYGYFLKSLIQNFYKRKRISQFLFDICLKEGDKSHKCRAFLDSGNRLSVENKPVVVVNYSVFSALFQSVPLTSLLLGKTENLPLKNCKYISAHGAFGTGAKILTFEVDQMQIFLEGDVNIIKDVTLGLALSRFQDMLSYEALLSPMLFNF